MAKLDYNPKLAQYLDENKPFLYAHLIKFERPARLGGKFLDNGNILLSNKYTRYAYITDASFDIEFNDNSTYWNGTQFVTNPAQVYRANKVLKVGSVGESADTKIANISISLDASSIDAYLPAQALTFASSSLITATDSFSLAGFREGDVVKFSSTSGANNGKSFRIISFRSEGKTILVETIDDTFTNETGFNYTTSIASTEITSLIDLDQSTNFVNRQVYIYKAFFNPLSPTLDSTNTTYYAGAPVLLFNGIITSADYKEDINSTPEITWTIRNHWGDFQQIRGRLTADEFHRALDIKGNPSHRGVIRPEYVYDKGFQHANKAIDILATYTTTETRYKKQTKSGPLGTNKKISFKPYEVAVTKEVDLRFNLQAKYLPVVYGVRRIDAIPVFVDTSATDPGQVYLVDAICEGPIQSLLNVYIDDNPLICNDEQDSALRDISTGSASADVVCYGRADRGDVLGGTSSQLLAKQTMNTTDYSLGVGSMPFNFAFSEEQLQSFQNLANLNAQNAAAEVNEYNTTASSAVAGSGLSHESKFNVSLPLPMDLEFKTGQEDQLASALLVSQANQNSGQGFKLQDNANISVNNYWGPDHRLLDTAYIVQKSTITEEQSTVPNLEYVVKGRLLPCYNYDYSFVKDPIRTSVSHTTFLLGDTVSIYSSVSNSLIASNVQIIDKWSFFGANGIQDYRFRFSATSKQHNLLQATKEFYMQKGTSRWYMITHDYSLGTFKPAEHLTKKVSSYTVTNNQIVATFAANTIPTYLVGNTTTEGSLSLDLPSVLNSLSQGEKINYSISSNYKLTVTSATSVTLQNSGSTAIDVTNLYLNISNKIKLPAGASGTSSYYVGYTAKITNYLPDGTTSTIYRKITAYDATNKVLTLLYPLAAEEIPTTASTVEIILPLEYGDYRPTTNPVIMLLDYMTNRKYGAGLIEAQLNRPAFLDAARTCDTTSDVTINVPSSATISLGAVYKYEHSSLFKWQGTVKSIGETVGSIKPVVFTYCIGKLTNKFNSWASRQLGDIIHDSDVTSNLYRVTTAGVQSSITTNTAQLTAGQFNLTRVSGSGSTSISLGVSAGNPIADYSLYDSDFIKYWKYLGWDSHDQRWVNRHQANLIINTSEPVLTNIGSILNHFNGALTFEDGKYSVYVETKLDPDSDLWWNFLNSAQDWTSTNITTTSTDSYISLNTTAATGAYFQKDGLNFLGLDNQLVKVKIRRTGGSGFTGRLWYTSLTNPSYNTTYSKVISQTLPLNEWVTLTWDMSTIPGLDPTDWISNFITGIRFELAASAADDFDIEWISIGTNIRVIEQEDIIGAITIKDEGLDRSFNSLSASIPDPQNNFNTRSVSFFNSDFLAEDRGIVKSTNFDLDGITNYYNARMGVEQVLRRSRYSRSISFTMRPIGMGLTPSDLIRIVYPRFGWTKGKYFRISTISHREDCLVTITAEEHSDTIYNIEASKKLKNISDNSGSKVYYTPDPVTNLTATSVQSTNEQLGQITLNWTPPAIANSFIPYIEVWRANTNNIEDAYLVANFMMGTSAPFISTYTDTGLDPAVSTPYYYWVRVTGTRIQNLNGRLIITDVVSSFTGPAAGSTKTGAAQYVVVNGPQVFSFIGDSETPTETEITLTASLFGGLTTYDWEYWNGSSWVDLSGTQNSNNYSLAYNNAAWDNLKNLRIRCLSGEYSDEMTIVKLSDGQTPVEISYTNSNHSVPVTVQGVENWNGSGGLLQVFEGTTPLVLFSSNQSTSYPNVNGRYVLDITNVSGDTLTEPTIPQASVGTTTTTIPNWAGNLTTATVYRITAYITTSKGAQVTRSIDASIIPAGQGETGIITYISTSSPVISKNSASATAPGVHSSITIQGKKTIGSTTTDFGFVTITPNGTTEPSTRIDTSLSPTTLAPINSAGKTSYTIRLYENATGGSAIDTEVIPVVFSGFNSLTLVATNDSHSVPVSSGGVETWTGSGTLIYVYDGATQLTLLNNGEVIQYPTEPGTYNLSISKVSGSNLTKPTITGANTTTATLGDWAGDLTTVTIYRVTAYITTSAGPQLPREIDITLSPSFQGSTGIDSTVNFIQLNSGFITKESVDPTISAPHSSIIIQGKRAVGTTITNFGFVTVTGNGDTESTTRTNTSSTPLTFTPANNAGKTSYTIRLYEAATGGSVLDSQEVRVLFKGANPAVAVYTNESHSIPVSNSGVETWTGSGGIFNVYEGITLLTLNQDALVTTATYPSAGRYNLGITKVSGSTLTLPTITGATTTAATLGDWAGDLTTVTVYRVSAYITTNTGAQIVRAVDISLSPSLQGASGNDTSIFWLAASTAILVKNNVNEFNPNSITFSSFFKTGNTTTSSYAGRFKIYENSSTNPAYTSSNDEVFKTYTPTASCTSIKTELFAAGGTTVKLDEIGVPILFANSSSINVVLTNETHVLPAASNGAIASYSGSGTIIRVYEGAVEIDYDGIGTANGKWKVVSAGTGIVPGSITESTVAAIYGDHSGMLDATETASISYTITGKNSIGESFSVVKTQTFTKAKSGDNITIIYRRSSIIPTTPTASTSTPPEWYDSLSTLPAGSDPVWASTGTRGTAGAGVNWVWQTPIKITNTSSGRSNPFTQNWAVQDPFVEYNGSLRHYYGGFGNMPIVSQTGPYNSPLNILRVRGTNPVSAPGWFGAYRFDYGDVEPSTNYLIYLWVKRRSSATTNGLIIGPAEASPGAVETLAGSVVTDPRFVNNIGSTLPVNQWVLFVGVINRQGTSSPSGISGFYTTTGSLVSGTTVTEFRHKTSSPVLRQRLRFGFNSASPTYGVSDGFDFYPVGIFKNDGSQPTIDEVLQGIPYYTGPQITGNLSNGNVTIPSASDGSGLNYTAAEGTFKVYDGGIDVTGTTDGPVYTVVGAPVNTRNTFTQNNLTFTINQTTGVYSLSGASWNTDTQSFTIRAWYRGQTIEQVYTISKARQGVSAYNGLLTNENATALQVISSVDYTPFASSGSITYSTVYENTGGTFKVYSGATEVTSNIVFGISGGTVEVTNTTKTQNGLTMTINNSTGVYSLAGTSWTTASESFILTASVGGVTLSKIYSINLSTNHIAAYLTTTSQLFKYDFAEANPSPAEIVFTATTSMPNNQAYGSYTYRFSKYNPGTNDWTVVRDYATTNTYTLAAGAIGLGTETYKVEVKGGGSNIIAADSTSILRVKDGLTGSNGSNTANVVLYRRTSSNTAPAVINDDSTYTFSTGLLSNANGLDSWSQTVPSGSSQYLWVTNATAIGANGATTATIPTTGWSTPVVQSEAQQLRTATKLIYNPSTATTGVIVPSSTSTGKPYNFTTGALTISTGGDPTTGWTNNQLVTPPYWVSSVSIAETTYDTTQTVTYGTPYRIGNTSNLDENGLNLANLGGSVGAGQVNITTGGDNLLMNSEFEIRDVNTPAGYTIYNNGGVGSSFIDVAGYISGKAAAVKAGGTPGNTLGISTSSELTSLGVTGGVENGWVKGVIYSVSFFAKKVAGSQITGMQLGWNNAPNAISTAVVNPNLTTGWQRYVFRIQWNTAQATTVEPLGRLYLTVSGTIQANDEIHIDRLTVELGDFATQWRAGRRDQVSITGENAPATLRNSNISFNVSNNTVSLANAGVGSINIGTFGYTGDLNATYGAVAGSTLRDSNGRTISDVRLLGNILDATTWVLGTTGSQTGFNQNPTSSGGSNSIVYASLPDGSTGPVWRAISGSATSSNPEGGWNTTNFNIDHTKMYRFSIWIRLVLQNNSGNLYLGVGPNTVKNISGGATNDNPYFLSPERAGFPQNEWLLLVGYVFPSTYTGAQLNKSGIYRSSNGQRLQAGVDYSWVTGATQTYHRTYQFYTTLAGNIQDFWNPRVDLMDGTEPSIDTLLAVGKGATAGVNLRSSDGTVVADASFLNSALSFSVANNLVSLANGGSGSIGIGSFGYTGELNATRGAVAGTNLRDSAGNVLSDAAVDNSYNITGQNLLPNSDAIANTWQVGYTPNGAVLREGDPILSKTASEGAAYTLLGITNNVVIRQDGVAPGTQDGSGDNAVAVDILQYMNNNPVEIPVIPGQKLIGSVYINAHRTKGRVYLEFRNSASEFLNNVMGTIVTGGGGSSNTLSGYTRSVVTATVPAAATTVRFWVRKFNTAAGQVNSYLWVAAPQLEVVNSNVSTPSPYRSGPTLSPRQIGYSGDLNATYGAQSGANLRDSAGNTLIDASFLNSSISLSAAGVLSGAGGGTVTLPGLGQSNYRILTIGLSSTSHPPGTYGLYKDGAHVHGIGRSYVLVTIKRSDGTRTFQTYDVFGNGESGGRTGATLAADLNALTSEFIVVVYSYDEPAGNRLLNNLPAAMYRCGASRAIFGSSEFKYRSAYALVGIPGVGEGNGAEFYQGAANSSTDAWIDVSFSVLNGNISGVSGKYTPRTLADYSYTGDLNATNGATAGANLRSSDGTVVADASFLNSSISLSAAGVLSGAGGGTISLGSLGGTLNTANQMAQNAITSRELAVSNDTSGGDGIFIDNVNQRIDIYNGGVLRMRFGKLT